MTTVTLAPVHLLRQWAEPNGSTYREYRDGTGRTLTVNATNAPFGEPRPEPDTRAEAALTFAGRRS